VGEGARSRGPARRVWVEPLAARLADPVPLPTGADHALDPWDGHSTAQSRLTASPTRAASPAAVIIEAVNRVDKRPLLHPHRGENNVSTCGRCG
jgi:hypothetical protein